MKEILKRQKFVAYKEHSDDMGNVSFGEAFLEMGMHALSR